MLSLPLAARASCTRRCSAPSGPSRSAGGARVARARSSPSAARAAGSARPRSPSTWPPGWSASPPPSTALVDLDLQRGDVAAFLNLTPVNSLANFATAPGEIDDLFLASTLTRHPNGVFVLPAPPEIEEADSVGHDEVKLALGLLRARFRYTVVDTARTDHRARPRRRSTRASGSCCVSDLSVPGVRAARRTVELLGRLGVPARARGAPGDRGGRRSGELQDAARAIGKQPFFVIPRDEASAAEAMNHGAPLNGKPTKLALAMTELAAKVAGVSSAAKPKPGQLLRRLFARTEGVHA